jgi:hypothetical protein
MPIKIPRAKGTQFPKDKQGWVKYINKLHDQAVTDRKPREFQWALNLAYYLGFQSLRYNPHNGDFFREMETEIYTINRISSYVEARMAKLSNINYIPVVSPDKLDPIKMAAAELAEDMYRHYWKVTDRDSKEKLLTLLTLIYGCAFKKVIWNSESGDVVQREKGLDKEGIAQLDSSGNPETEDIFLGKFEFHVKSPFAVLSDSDAMDLDDDYNWIIDRTFMTLEEAQAKYKNVDADMALLTEEPTQYESLTQRLSSSIFTGMSGLTVSKSVQKPEIKEERRVLVKEFWKKPSKHYPKGILAVVVGSQLVHFTGWPEGYSRCPIIKLDEKKNPIGFYGLSTLERLIPIQRRYNEYRTRISSSAALMANPKWMSPKGAGLAEDALTDEEGEVVEYNPAYPAPHQAAIAPLPNYVVESGREDIIDFRDVSGEQEASQQPFGGLTAAVAMQEAASQQNQILGPTISYIKESIESEGELVLQLIVKYWNDPRKIAILGENRVVASQIVTGEMIKNQTDFTISVESGLGESKASNRQALMDMWDRGIIRDPEKLLEAYRAGKLDVATDDQDEDKLAVIEDIVAIKEGKQPPIGPMDNHALFIKMLSKFMSTPEFRRLAPDRQQIAMMALQQHAQFMQPKQEPGQNNPAAVGTPFGSQKPEGR